MTSDDGGCVVVLIAFVIVAAAAAQIGHAVGYNAGWRCSHAYLLNGKARDLGWEAYKVILPSGEQQYFEYLKTP